MARTVRDAKLETRAARSRLKARKKEYWRTLLPGRLHLGYRRRRKDAPGVWLTRCYLGLDGGGAGRYRTETLPGFADDYQDADGVDILSYAQAQEIAHQRSSSGAAERRPLTVADAIDDYVAFLELERKTAADARRRATS